MRGNQLGQEGQETCVLVLALPPAYWGIMQALSPLWASVSLLAKGQQVGPLGLEGPSHLWHSEHLWAWSHLAGTSQALEAGRCCPETKFLVGTSP